MANRRTQQAILAYLVVAYSLSWVGQGVIWASGGLDGTLFPLLAPILMFTPAIGAFFASRFDRTRFLRLLRLQAGAFPVVVGVLIPLVTSLAVAFAIADWLGGYPPPWTMVSGGFEVPEDSALLMTGSLGLPSLLASLFVTAGLLSVLAGLLALGEEIGWRGYLQPRLCLRFGTIRGLCLVGLVWAVWHLPLLLMGYVFPEAPILGAFLLFPMAGVGLSLFLGWLRIVSGGIWAPILAHGAYNAFFGSFVFGMDFAGRSDAAYCTIVAATIITGLVCVPLLLRSSNSSSL